MQPMAVPGVLNFKIKKHAFNCGRTAIRVKGTLQCVVVFFILFLEITCTVKACIKKDFGLCADTYTNQPRSYILSNYSVSNYFFKAHH